MEVEASPDSESVDLDLQEEGKEASASLEKEADRVKEDTEEKIPFGTLARRTTGKSWGWVTFVEKNAIEQADASSWS